jgi:hypothetical protein
MHPSLVHSRAINAKETVGLELGGVTSALIVASV